MGKLQFFEMREQEIATMYAQDFTKKQAQQTGLKLVSNVIENGEVDKMQFMANLVRLHEVVATATAEMRNHIPNEKAQIFGVEFIPVNGGNTINYSEDEIYQNLQDQMKKRAEQLKMAVTNNEEFTIDGVYVPLVSTTPRKDSITIKF